jgi:hypothetical protein
LLVSRAAGGERIAMRYRKLIELQLVLVGVLAAPAPAASLTTGYTWCSGWCAGPYIDLTAATGDVTVDSFDMYFKGTLPRDVSVYYRVGSHVGHELTAASWTLIGTVPVVPLGDGILTHVPLGGVVIPAGQVYGFKVWDNLATGGASGGGLILYSGGLTVSDPDLTLTSDTYTCDFPFSGTVAHSWGWQGTVNYTVGTPPSVIVHTVSSTFTDVYPGQVGVDLQVTVENAGVNPLDLVAVTISFTDSLLVDRSGEYALLPAPGQPTTIQPGQTAALTWAVDVLPGATPETITIDAAVEAIDTVTAQTAQDPEADTPHVWTVLPCGYSLCGDCDDNGHVDVLDALLAAQIAAGLQAPPPTGSLQWNGCNAQGVTFPDPGAAINILDALEIARSSAGLGILSCC